jgi:hypothetical protein
MYILKILPYIHFEKYTASSATGNTQSQIFRIPFKFPNYYYIQVQEAFLVVDSRTEMSVHEYKYALGFSGDIWGTTFAIYPNKYKEHSSSTDLSNAVKLYTINGNNYLLNVEIPNYTWSAKHAIAACEVRSMSNFMLLLYLVLNIILAFYFII